MKMTELLTDERVCSKAYELIEGANKLKKAKKFFERIDRKPDFLDGLYKMEFWEHIDEIDTKLLETIEEVNRAIAFLIFRELNNKIND